MAAQALTNFTPLLLAKEKGWFAEQNLTVTWTMITQAAIAVEAVFGGSAEVGGGGILELPLPQMADESWLRANADAARRFKRAVDRATAFMNDSPKEVRNAWIAKFTGVRADLVERARG